MRFSFLFLLELFITKMPGAEANFAEYESVRLKSKIARNPHKEVLDWFEKKFPYYQKLMVVQDGDVIWNALDEYRKALEEQSIRMSGNIIPINVKAAESVKKDIAG